MAIVWNLLPRSMFRCLFWEEVVTLSVMLHVLGAMKHRYCSNNQLQRVHHISFLAHFSKELPYNDYIEYYGPDFRLHIPSTNMENQNSKDYLEKYKYVIYPPNSDTLLRNKILENIRRIGRPNTYKGASSDLPPEASDSEDEEQLDPDNRRNSKRMATMQQLIW